MRLSPPPSLRLDRSRLLADLVARVARTRPELAEALGDPADPSWLLIEQAAWMVERLSEQLDALPHATLQRMGAWLGAQLRPATPAIGVVTLTPREPGLLSWGADRPSPWRLFTAQTETRGLIEFSLFERGAPVRPATLRSWTAVRQGELVGRAGRVRALDGARVRYRINTTSPEDTKTRLSAAATALRERRLGWLNLEVRTRGDAEVVVEAWVDLSGVFARTAPEGLTRGGDLEGDLGSLDTAPWTPAVRLAALPGLPRARHGEVPLPGRAEGALLVPDLPADLPVAALLDGRVWPLPASVVQGIWTALVHQDSALAGLRPTVEHALQPQADPAEPTWLASALNAAAWGRLADREGRQLLHVTLEGRSTVPLRIGLIHPTGSRPTAPTGWFLSRGVLHPESMSARESWSIHLPAADRPGLVGLSAFDLPVPPDADAVILTLDAEPLEVLLNTTLVINAPPVLDGRELTLRRAVPEAITLLSEDLVDRGVLDRLLEHPLSSAVRQHLRRLPLASFAVEGGPPIRDLAGLSVDTGSGEIVFGAPDPLGAVLELPVGATVSLDWYRCTQGADGEVEAGAIQFVEQPPRTSPAIDAARNPLGTFYGQAREPEEACRARVFGPADPSPVLPGDWERAVRAELGARGQGWSVRCWSHAERALLSYALWPLDPDDDAAATLRQELDAAGPDVLLVALGPAEGPLSEAELAWASEVIAGLVRRTWERRPLVREALVTRLWPLTLVGTAPADLVLPCHHPPALGAGALVDGLGRRRKAPRERLMLNAAVIAVRPEEAP